MITHCGDWQELRVQIRATDEQGYPNILGLCSSHLSYNSVSEGREMTAGKVRILCDCDMLS